VPKTIWTGHLLVEGVEYRLQNVIQASRGIHIHGFRRDRRLRVLDGAQQHIGLSDRRLAVEVERLRGSDTASGDRERVLVAIDAVCGPVREVA
jgi:hypothetical protein